MVANDLVVAAARVIATCVATRRLGVSVHHVAVGVGVSVLPATASVVLPLSRCHPWLLLGDNVRVRIERSRENIFTVTATSQELSALVAGARMALEAMRGAPEQPPADAIEILERVLGEFDRARERLTTGPEAGG